MLFQNPWLTFFCETQNTIFYTIAMNGDCLEEKCIAQWLLFLSSGDLVVILMYFSF